MKFSIVLPSYLGQYKGAAKNRPEKLARAIKSALSQTHTDFELIIIADGCVLTGEVVKQFTDSRIKLIEIEKQELWSGVVRNTGIEAATGDYIVYLDSDDMLGTNHLEIISKGIEANPVAQWYFFNDLIPIDEMFTERYCAISIGGCGTSNLAHPKEPCRWLKNDGYAHDWNFIKELRNWSKKYTHIGCGEYLVCHIPNQIDI